MKIKITEEQYRLLKNINESAVNVEPYLSELNKIELVANGYYNRLTFTTIAELINGEVSFNELRDLSDKTNELWRKTTKIMNTAENEINTLGDTQEAYDLLDNIDEYQSYIKNKLDVVSEILDFLIKIQDTSNEADWLKYFTNINKTEI